VNSLLREIRPTLSLAIPIIVGQVSQMLIGITDSAMIGRVGTTSLAAAAFTGGVFSLFFVVCIGLLLPVGVFAARDAGAGKLGECAAWLHHGRVIAVGVGLIAFGLLAAMSTQLHRFGQPPDVVAIVRPFFLLISLSLIPVLLFQVQRQFAESMRRPWVPMIIMLADVGLNALLNRIFIWGHWGAPALGLVGSGLSTLLARSVAVVVLGLWLRRSPTFAGVWAKSERRLERRRFRTLFDMGVPAANSLLFETGAYAAAA
jgi:MATE family multidrug resistance protein